MLVATFLARKMHHPSRRKGAPGGGGKGLFFFLFFFFFLHVLCLCEPFSEAFYILSACGKIFTLLTLFICLFALPLCFTLFFVGLFFSSILDSGSLPLSPLMFLVFLPSRLELIQTPHPPRPHLTPYCAAHISPHFLHRTTYTQSRPFWGGGGRVVGRSASVAHFILNYVSD